MDSIIKIHIKILRGNFYLYISDSVGKLMFNKSCGSLGFKNIQKRNKDAFQALLSHGLQYLLHLSLKNSLFIKIEGAKKDSLKQINTQFIDIIKSYDIKIFGIKLVNKIAHNGCRKPYFKK
jgi:ribosomal protein S11